MARRTDRGVHGRHARRDGAGTQAVEAHAVPGRSRARGEWHEIAPVSPRSLPRLPPRRARRPADPQGKGRLSPRSRAMTGPLDTPPLAGRVTHRSALDEPYLAGPALTEPDLPRTAKVRPRALRTGWTTGTCASAAAKAAATALRDQAAQEGVEVALPGGRRVGFEVESCSF